MVKQIVPECPATPIRVLHVLGELRPSGAEVMLRVAARHFQEKNVQCEILSTGEERIGDYADILAGAGYRIHYLAFNRSLSFFRAFSQLVSSGRYDVVHLHAERAALWFALAARPWARIVRTVHSNFTFNGSLRIRRVLTRWLSRLVGVRHLAISPSVQNNERDRFFNLTVLAPNWFDDIKFHPPSKEERDRARAAFGLTAEDFVIITVGNCSPIKNHQAVIKAISELSGERQIIYLHVGEEDDRGSERVLAEQLGIGARVRFLGHRSDVQEVLFSGDCFVMPSIYEGFGIAALEALAVGLPLVLSDIPAFRDLGEEFEDVYFCRSDSSDLVEQIRKVMALAADERALVASKNSARASELFGSARGVERYCKAYLEKASLSEAII